MIQMDEANEKLMREIDNLGRHQIEQLKKQNSDNIRLIRAAHHRVQVAVKQAADKKEKIAREAATAAIQRVQDRLQSELELIRDHCIKALEMNDHKRDEELLRLRDAFVTAEDGYFKEVSAMVERIACEVCPQIDESAVKGGSSENNT